MAFWDPVQPRHVRQAVAEYDGLGQEAFLGQLPIRCRLRFLSLFHQLGSQRTPVASMVKDPGRRLAPGRGDDVRYLVADELVVGDTHGRTIALPHHR
jgi:hypothetical protein